MTETASITPAKTHEEILSRLPPHVRRMTDRDSFVLAMFTPEFPRAVKNILAEDGD